MERPRVQLSTQLTTQAHSEPIVRGLRDLAAAVNQLDPALAALTVRVSNLRIPTLQQIRAALQVSGGAPLNITQLIPSGSTTAAGNVLVGVHADRLTLATSALTIGDLYLETDRVAWYEWTSSGWVFLGNLYSPMDVTLDSPDTKPADLGAGDVGFFVFATDYCRYYRWDGSAWTEDNHNPPRYQIGWFADTPDQNGWFLCDGSTVSRSVDDGTVTNYTTPDLITDNPVIRGAATAGGTGGAATHDHAVNIFTGTPDLTGTVHDGGGAALGYATDGHVHLVNGTTATASSYPPYYEAIPYIRL